MRIRSIDHIVLTTKDLQACIHFYSGLLGMEHRVTDGQHAFFFGKQKINIHTRPGEFQPAAQNIASGSQDFCLIVEEDMEKIREELLGKGAQIHLDMVERTGALGRMLSIYLYDPDGNLVELAKYR